MAADPDGRKLIRQEHTGDAKSAERIGSELADRLLALGAGKLLGGR
jgi:hypothetical protein